MSFSTSDDRLDREHQYGWPRKVECVIECDRADAYQNAVLGDILTDGEGFTVQVIGTLRPGWVNLSFFEVYSKERGKGWWAGGMLFNSALELMQYLMQQFVAYEDIAVRNGNKK